MSTQEDSRPDPELLLKAIRQETERKNKGKLRMFFGMSAGVGKTYTMLEAAHALQDDGLDVVAAVVETHGRQETSALLEGIASLQRKKIEYRGKFFEEMDIDAVLARRPAVVLVDELAHTNIPGSRHEKRWQDVLEILDNGIDVYTTLNVQHVESRKEDVELITGIRVSETVPDSVLERADQIELVDITPAELLERLGEGKVYLGERAAAAADNFFKVEKITALRELALKITSQVVSNELQNMSAAQGAASKNLITGNLLVAVGYSAHSQRLIRAARRLAFASEVPWIAVNIETGANLNSGESAQLNSNLELARRLGAKVITITDTDILPALKRIIEQNKIAQVIVGRPQSGFIRNFMAGGTLLGRLIKETNVDIYVLREPEITGRAARTKYPRPLNIMATRGDYWKTFLIVAAVTAANSVLVHYINYHSAGFLYLLSIMFIGSFASLGPLVFAAVLSSGVWNFFFIPPFFTFAISRQDDIIMCAAYFFTALITAVLAHRIRKNRQLLQITEQHTELMFEIVEIIAHSSDREQCLTRLSERIGIDFDGHCSVSYMKTDGQMEEIPAPLIRRFADEKEQAVAKWAFDNNQPAGWSTDTLSMARSINLPLKGITEMTGVLSFTPNKPDSFLSMDDKNLLTAIAWQVAVFLEQEAYKDRARESERLKESERLYQTILDSISHEIKTPLTAIMGLASVLNGGEIRDEKSRARLLDELSESSERLNREVGNILDMSRLSSGIINLKREWTDVREIIESSLGKLEKYVKDHTVRVSVPDDIPFVRVDFTLFESAVTNLLLNAAKYTPAGSAIEVSVRAADGKILLTVADNGPGLAADQLVSVFEKFYRVPGTPSGGTGLGLSIAKSVVELHGGAITAQDRPQGGLEIVISLPLERQPDLGEQ